MKLTLVISSLSSGGAEHVLSKLANYWISKGHYVSLITLASPESQPFYPLDPGVKLIQLDQLNLNRSPFTRYIGIFKRLFCLRKTIRELKPDVVISFMDVMNITTILATLELRLPLVISERIDPHFHKIPAFYNWLRIKLYPLAFQLIVQTQSAAQYFPKRIFRRLQIIPNLVDKSKVQPKVFLKKITQLISVGRLDPQKDHPTLISSFAKLLKHDRTLNLIIYGEGPERNNLETLIQTLNLKDKVFLPGVTQNIQQALHEADLFIFPSRYEGFPNALSDAMAIGLPVIASNCSGNVDIVRDKIDGRLFPIGNADALTTIALELMNDPDQCLRLSFEAQKITERFPPERIYGLWDEVIKDAYQTTHKN